MFGCCAYDDTVYMRCTWKHIYFSLAFSLCPLSTKCMERKSIRVRVGPRVSSMKMNGECTIKVNLRLLVCKIGSSTVDLSIFLLEMVVCFVRGV